MTGPGRNLSHHRLFSCSVLVLTLERARMRKPRELPAGLERLTPGVAAWDARELPITTGDI